MESRGSEGLDRLSNTFTKDRAFCDALAKTQPSETARLFIYLRWARLYMTAIQEDLHSIVQQHFQPNHRRDADFWTMVLTAGIFKDLGLIPYLLVRGIIWDAGFAVRRSLENAGVLAHFWADPNKAGCLADSDSGEFKNAFIAETDKIQAAQLREAGIQKRFAACGMGKPMSELYRMFSAYSIHGGAPHQMVHTELEPTRQSCLFVNRPDPSAKDLTQAMKLFAFGSEILCLEISRVHGTYAKQYGLTPTEGGQGGFFLTKLLDDGRNSFKDQLIADTIRDLGWLGAAS